MSGLNASSSRAIKPKSVFFQSKASGVGLVEESVPSKRDLASSSSLSVISGEDIDKILDSTICYHPQCSFAYNLTQKHMRSASLIAECVPTLTYQRIAALWNLDPTKTPRKHGNICQKENVEEENLKLENFLKSVGRDIGIRSEISEDLLVNADSDKESSVEFRAVTETKENPYLKFMRNHSAFDVERRNKSDLRKKAKKITEMIIKNFLDWYQMLGGNDGETLIDESTLQELFQIGFDLPEAKALVIRIKELPTVPECLATLRNEPKHSTSYALREFLKQDIKKENIPVKMFAFGSMLPKEYPPLRYKPPRNNVRQTWMECERVPEDLDTMKTIWTGLEKLRSTIAFGNWLKNHPEINPPTYLKSKGLLNINYEEWSQMYKGFELEVEPVEVVSSEWQADTRSLDKEKLGEEHSNSNQSF